MVNNSDFRFDLQLGLKGENLLKKILTNKKIEVKTDFIAKRTGNLFVEFECSGKPSGIARSEAEYYCFIISNTQFIVIETNKLKAIARSVYLNRGFKMGGDSNKAKGVLIKIKELLD